MTSIHGLTWRAPRASGGRGFALVLGSSAGHAQQLTDAQKNAIRSSCRSDFMANCMSVSPGGKEALMCLEKNMAKLSPACQKPVGDIMPKAPPAAAAAPRRQRHRPRPPRLRHLRLRRPRRTATGQTTPARQLRHRRPPHRRPQGSPAAAIRPGSREHCRRELRAFPGL